MAIKAHVDKYFQGEAAQARLTEEIDNRVDVLVRERVDAFRYPNAFSSGDSIKQRGESEQRAAEDYPQDT